MPSAAALGRRPSNRPFGPPPRRTGIRRRGAERRLRAAWAAARATQSTGRRWSFDHRRSPIRRLGDRPRPARVSPYGVDGFAVGDGDQPGLHVRVGGQLWISPQRREERLRPGFVGVRPSQHGSTDPEHGRAVIGHNFFERSLHDHHLVDDGAPANVRWDGSISDLAYRGNGTDRPDASRCRPPGPPSAGVPAGRICARSRLPTEVRCASPPRRNGPARSTCSSSGPRTGSRSAPSPAPCPAGWRSARVTG